MHYGMGMLERVNGQHSIVLGGICAVAASQLTNNGKIILTVVSEFARAGNILIILLRIWVRTLAPNIL